MLGSEAHAKTAQIDTVDTKAQIGNKKFSIPLIL